MSCEGNSMDLALQSVLGRGGVTVPQHTPPHNRGKCSHPCFLRGASEDHEGNKGTPVCLWGSRAGGGEGGPTKDPQLCVCKQGS